MEKMECFIAKIKAYLLDNEVKEERIKFYRKGFTSADYKELNFIRDTNNKYYKDKSDVLMGNFLVISGGENKDVFSRVCLDDIILLNDEDVYNILKENVVDSQFCKKTERLNVIDDYEQVKDYLIIRPLNLKKNEHLLEDSIYKVINDIALVLYIVLEDTKESGLVSAKVPKEVLDAWKMTEEEVMEKTMLNTQRLAPARIFIDINDIMNDTENPSDANGRFMEEDSPNYQIGNGHPFITTTKKLNGAIALFYPNVKEKLAEIMGDSYYISFLSTNEAVLQKDNTMSPETLLKLLRDNNRMFDDDETLTDSLFYYNASTKTIEVYKECERVTA